MRAAFSQRQWPFGCVVQASDVLKSRESGEPHPRIHCLTVGIRIPAVFALGMCLHLHSGTTFVTINSLGYPTEDMPSRPFIGSSTILEQVAPSLVNNSPTFSAVRSIAHSHTPAHMCVYSGAQVQYSRVRCLKRNAEIETQLEIQSEMLSVARQLQHQETFLLMLHQSDHTTTLESLLSLRVTISV